MSKVYTVSAYQCPVQHIARPVGIFTDLNKAKQARAEFIKSKKRKVLYSHEQCSGFIKVFDLKITAKKSVRWMIVIWGPKELDTV